MTLDMALKPSEFFKHVDVLESDAGVALSCADGLVSWCRNVLERARQLRSFADNAGVPENAQDQIAGLRRMLDEGPPDGDGYATPKEEPVTPKSRLPKGLMAKMREMCAEGPRAASELAPHSANVIAEAASKAGLVAWTITDTDGISERFMFGKPEHKTAMAPRGQGYAEGPKCDGAVGAGETNGARMDREMKEYEALAGHKVGEAPVDKRALAERIRGVTDWESLLPSEVASYLGVPLQDVRAAWPLLTGEKAQ